MRLETTTRELFTFAELSDSAKETAIEAESLAQAEMYEPYYALEDFATICGILGITLRTHEVRLMSGKTRQKADIWYSGFCSQGDGACFEGNYRYVPGSAKSIREHAPVDTELHAIADALQREQRPCFYQLEARMIHSGRYCHAYSMDVDVTLAGDEYRDLPEGVGEQVTDLMRDLAKWLYKQLDAEYWHVQSREYCLENLEQNEMEFTAEGRLA